MTGYYELCAILTHQGRSADSGHYIAWVLGNDGESTKLSARFVNCCFVCIGWLGGHRVSPPFFFSSPQKGEEDYTTVLFDHPGVLPFSHMRKGKWLKFDDDKVSEVSEDEVKKLSGKGGRKLLLWHQKGLTMLQQWIGTLRISVCIEVEILRALMFDLHTLTQH